METLIIKNEMFGYKAEIESLCEDGIWYSCFKMFDNVDRPVVMQIDGFRHSLDDIITRYRNFIINEYTNGINYMQNIILNDTLLKLKKEIFKMSNATKEVI